MRACVPDGYPWRIVTACGGVEFVKREYRPVPAGREMDALAYADAGLLQIEPEPRPEQKPAPIKPRRKRAAKTE